GPGERDASTSVRATTRTGCHGGRRPPQVPASSPASAAGSGQVGRDVTGPAGADGGGEPGVDASRRHPPPGGVDADPHRPLPEPPTGGHRPAGHHTTWRLAAGTSGSPAPTGPTRRQPGAGCRAAPRPPPAACALAAL